MYDDALEPLLRRYEADIDRAVAVGTRYANSQAGRLVGQILTWFRERSVTILSVVSQSPGRLRRGAGGRSSP